MAYLIPFVCAYAVYLYNYRKINGIRNEIQTLYINIMNDNDKWITDKFEKVFEKISALDKRLSKLEARLGVYVVIAVFIGQTFVKYVLK